MLYLVSPLGSRCCCCIFDSRSCRLTGFGSYAEKPRKSSQLYCKGGEGEESACRLAAAGTLFSSSTHANFVPTSPAGASRPSNTHTHTHTHTQTYAHAHA